MADWERVGRRFRARHRGPCAGCDAPIEVNGAAWRWEQDGRVVFCHPDCKPADEPPKQGRGHRHHLVLVDRSKVDGVPHRHRWAPTCDCGCGWKGQYRRRKQEAVAQYRAYVEGSQRGRRTYEQAHGGRAGRPIEPRPLTPACDLPEELL